MADFFDGIAHARSDKPGWLADADARARLARLIGGDARRLAFTKNTTEGLNTVAQGLPWREGDNLVVDDQEHPSNALPWLSLRRRGVDVRVASSGGHRYTVDDIWARVDARTRLVALSWVQYATGLRSDIAELGRRAARDIWLVVDGAGRRPAARAGRRLGRGRVRLGAHKGLLGPLGVGFLHLSPALLDALDPPHLGRPVACRWTSPDPVARRRARPPGRAAAGDRQSELPRHRRLGRALDLIEQADPARIEPWALELSRALADGLRGLGLDVCRRPTRPCAAPPRRCACPIRRPRWPIWPSRRGGQHCGVWLRAPVIGRL